MTIIIIVQIISSSGEMKYCTRTINTLSQIFTFTSKFENYPKMMLLINSSSNRYICHSAHIHETAKILTTMTSWYIYGHRSYNQIHL